jgi:PAS domain S-box-containing protein
VGVQGKIVLLALAAVGMTALCSGIFIVQTRANIEAQVFQDQASLGQGYARVVQEYLDGSRSVMEGLARVPAVRAALHPELKQAAIHGIPQDVDVERRASIAGVIDGSGRVLSIISAGANGDVYMMEPFAKQLGFPLTNLRASNPELIATVLSTRKPTWSDILIDRGTNLPTVVLQLPITDESGAIVSILGTSLGLEGLAEAARSIQPGKSGGIMLFDRQGAPVVYPDAARIAATQPLTDMPLVQRELDGQTGSFAYFNPLTEQDELGTAVPLDNGWFVVVTRTQAEAFDGLNRTIATLLVVLGVSMVLMLVAGLYLARSIAGALGAVARAATGLASGDLDQQVDVWSNDEVGRMAGAFREMMAYHLRMAAIADAVASGDLSADVEPQSDRDRLGIALHGMVHNLRTLVESLRIRDRALASASSPVVITESTGGPFGPIVFANPAFERLTGYAESEVLGGSMEFMRGPQTDPQAIEKFFAITREGRSDTNEIIGYHKDGTTTFWTEVAAAPVRDAKGDVTHYVWVLNDISARKEAEKQAESLARAEKLRALGQMASGIAHDLNQSLMLIASYGHLGGQALEVESLDRAELREMFTVVTQAAMDGGDTVKRLLQFARAPTKGQSQPIDLTLLLREVAQLTAPRWRDAAQADGRPIALEIETLGHPVILGAPAALREVLTNLVLNAVDALPGGGTILLRVSQEGDRAVLEVVDDGVGMAPEVQSHIFEPFFTTKGEGGTGLGLATVFGIVERLGGQVSVQSAPGQGTTFRLEFAATASAGVRVEAPLLATGAPVRRLRILAVDDEPALTKVVMRLLRPIGHLVTMASSGEEALEKLAAEPFDVVLSDVGMGAGMNGWELAERVRRGWPQVRFALATGWGAAIDPVEARDKGVIAVLSKPYSAAELVEVLAAAA